MITWAQNAPITKSFTDLRYHLYFWIRIGNKNELMKPKMTEDAPSILESTESKPNGSIKKVMMAERQTADPFMIM